MKYRPFLLTALLIGGMSSHANAQTPAPPPPPEDPVSAIEGKWYETTRKIEVTVVNGVATITDFQTSSDRWLVPFKKDFVVARLNNNTTNQNPWIKSFTNSECASSTGNISVPGEWKYMQCYSGATISYTPIGGKYVMSLWLPYMQFIRRESFPKEGMFLWERRH